MALQKQTTSINFQKGLDTKPDPKQLAIGSFTSLKNSVFDKLGQMKKRNGYAAITSLPNAASFLTTFKNNLTAIGNTLQSFSQGSNTWVQSGAIQPLQMSVLPLIRNSVNQTYADSAVSSSNLVCTVYAETTGSTQSFKFVVSDAATGQNVIASTALAADATLGTPKVFVLGSYFVIVYTNHPSAYNLKFIAINTITLVVGAPQTISTSVTPAATVNFGGVVYNNSLYIAWNGASSSGIQATFITSTLVTSSTVTVDGAHSATVLSMTADSAGVLWVNYYNSATSTGYSAAISPALSSVLAPTQIISTGTIANITSAAQNGVNTLFYEVTNSYTYDSGVPTNFIMTNTLTQSGTLGTPAVCLRSVGLASQAFTISGNIYFMSAYSSPYQPTYFMVKSTSTSANPVVIAKYAYSNGGGYCTTGLPSAIVSGTTVNVAYLFKDLVEAVNKNTNVPAGSQVNGVYAQTGANLITINLTTSGLSTAEIGNDLHISGGFLWGYDGVTPVEHNFFLYPDSVESSAQATTGGFLAAQIYYYQIVYRWADNQGNIFRSAPSIPITVDIHSSGTATNTITLKIPTLRLTYKIANPVIIEIYRWSTNQQTYYQTGQTATPIFNPILNDPTTDFVTVVDLNSDATILGNNILYTTGGVLEDVNAPSFNAMTLFDTRLWGIDAEDPNVAWPSKTVLEATPVEFSPEDTIYVAPNISEKQSTGPLRCLFPMDDKIIFFKESTLYYINGTGPDITGANSQYSEPTFIASPVGCSNQNSIVLIPRGLMFQSKVGIWLLGRDLSVSYIGAPVESFNSATVLSAVSIPNSNQVRFTLSTGTTLMYDHYTGQWGEFEGVAGVSSTIYNSLHTYMSTPVTVTPPTGQPYTTPSQVYQETPGLYLDGSRPVNMSFVTGWISLAGVQGYKRAYYLFLLGQYSSPHTFTMGIAFDYATSIVQQPQIFPNNSNGLWGGNDLWGDDDNVDLVNDNNWGGSNAVEQWQINFQNQLCQSFQLTFNEIFDATQGLPAGAGLTISTLNLVYGAKKGFSKNIAAANTTG